MNRVHLALWVAVAAFVALVSCGKQDRSAPVILHVWRDTAAPFARQLKEADSQFALAKPHLQNGQPILVATNEGHSFALLLENIGRWSPGLLVLNAKSDLTPDMTRHLASGKPEMVCGNHPAYLLSGASSQEREAARIYVEFLRTHCRSISP